MNSLFLRIFLWFWGLLAAVVLALVILSPQMTRPSIMPVDWEQRTATRVEWFAKRLCHMVDDLGAEKAISARFGASPGPLPPGIPELWIIDGSDKVLYSHRPPPRDALEVARQALSTGADAHLRDASAYYFARPAGRPNEPKVAVVLGDPLPPRPMDLLEFRTLAPRVLVLLVVATAFCFWLARYLASPVRSLRETMHSIVSGNLATRIPAQLTGRGDEIGQLAREINALAERVDHVVSSQRRLVRDISHELRSPLTRLGVALELARQKAPGQALGEHDRIELESKRLDEMLGRLLDISRLEADGPGLVLQDVDISALLGAVVSDAAFESAARGCTIETSLAPACTGRGEPVLLRSAFENVVRNAVQHTVDGSAIEVSLTREPLDGGERFVVAIRDRGPGVPDAFLDQIFKPFVRVDEARDLTRGGAGLGLAIAAKAVEAHGGTIRASNAPGGGLQIAIVLPAAHRATAVANPPLS